MGISFIVPVYNTKISLLRRCVSSIEELEIVDYEIIIINDGSSNDNTREYKDFLIGKKNIIYIEHKNRGVSYSRNYGIGRATKEYIAFVDSDDVVLCKQFKEEGIEFGEDIILLRYHNKFNNKNAGYSFSPGPVARSALLKEAVSTCNYCSPFAKLFKRKYLISHSILFDESFIQGEDALFNLCCLEFSPTIHYYDTVFYEYDYSGSNTENRWRRNFEKCLDNKYYIYFKKQELIRDLCAQNEEADLLAENDREFVRSAFYSYRFLVAINDSRKLKKYVEKLKSINLNKKNLGLKERIYYVLLVSDNVFLREIVNLIRKK